MGGFRVRCINRISNWIPYRVGLVVQMTGLSEKTVKAWKCKCCKYPSLYFVKHTCRKYSDRDGMVDVKNCVCGNGNFLQQEDADLWKELSLVELSDVVLAVQKLRKRVEAYKNAEERCHPKLKCVQMRLNDVLEDIDSVFGGNKK